MKALIVYYSSYSNTEKIAKIFAKKINADLVNLKESSDVKVDNYDLIGFGSGVYKESMAPKLLDCAEKLELKGKKVFVFSTSGLGMKFYNNKMRKIFKSKGAICKGSFACKGHYESIRNSKNKMFELFRKISEGHPNDKDIYKAEKFIENVVKTM